jgi:Cu2+-exporting ATPase
MDLALRCHHCGESLPADAPFVTFDGVALPVCCAGCAAAARWIRDAGLGDYYRLRQREAPRAASGDDDYRAWDHPDVLAEHARAVPGGMELTLLTEGMRCAACAWLIDRALGAQAGVIEVGANAVTGRIRLRWDPVRTGLAPLLARLAGLGFVPHLATGATREAALQRERRRDVLRLGVAGLGAMQAMMFAEALYLDTSGEMPLATRDFLRWIAFLVSTPVVFFAGWPFLAGFARELRMRRLGMDTLVATSVLLAYGASLVETVRGGMHVWYDAAVMFVFLLLCARQLEAWARRRASAQVDALARARPALALRETAAGGTQTVALAQLAPGDVMRVPAGEVLPGDGELLEAAAAFDEALLTGESVAVPRQPGDTVLAGSIAPRQAIRLRLTRVGSETRLADLVRLVERAQEGRPRLARIADRVASRFVAVMLVLAAGVFAAWWSIEPARAFEVTLAVLVVGCPCALSLAIPAALAAAHGRLARLGVLALRGDALETLARVDTVMFDKTGTLTGERPELQAVEPCAGQDRAEVLALAAALQRDNRHPLAQAFAPFAGAARAAATQQVAGAGIEGRIDGVVHRLGRADFACGASDDGAVWLARDGVALARFTLRDALRPDACAAVDALRAAGLGLELSSGDGAAAVAAVADTLGIARAASRQAPADKLARLRGLQAEGHVVAMLGDGINDAPVLAGADVSFALGGGAALAHRAADFVLAGASLRRVPQALALARRTRAIVRQNLAWAIAYNALALPFAAAGLVAPWLAAIGMALSSLLVTLNALRLLREDA